MLAFLLSVTMLPVVFPLKNAQAAAGTLMTVDFEDYEVGVINEATDTTGIHVAAKLDRMYPNQYKFYNRGISGHKVTDLIGRWKRDCIKLKPDYISILIGVNDVWHEVGNNDGTDNDVFEQVYDILLGITKKYLPDVKIFLMEPFFLKDAYNPELKEAFAEGVAEKREIVKKLAAKYGLKTIPLQEIFEDEMKSADEFWWTAEGVHPTNAGHQVIADAWVELFEEIK